MSDQKINPYNGTPENYLTFNYEGDGLDESAINCALIRAKALVNLLHSQFSSGRNIERVSDEVLVAALWGITGYLDQIKILTKGCE
jgi:hypothetical protein